MIERCQNNIQTKSIGDNAAPEKRAGKMKCFEIWWADLPILEGSHVQHGRRPVIIVSNDTVNNHGPIVSVIPITTNIRKTGFSAHVRLRQNGFLQESIALCDHLLTIDKSALLQQVGYLWNKQEQNALQRAISVHLNLTV